MPKVRVQTSDRGGLDILVDPHYLVESGCTDHHNMYIVADGICALLALLSDSPLPSKPLKPKRLYLKLLRDISSRPIEETVKKFAGLAHTLLFSEEVHSEGTGDRPFIGEMIDTPVFREYHHFFKTSDPHCLRFVHSVLVYLKKMNVERDDLSAIALRDWLAIEEKLDTPLGNEEVLEDLSSIIRVILPVPDRATFHPKHGPGQTAEKSGRRVDGKHIYMRLDRRGVRLFKTIVNPIDDWDGYATDVDCKIDAELVSPSAVLMFVPKDLTKMRSICMEPVARQYLQQGVLSMLLASFDNGYIGRWVKINDQTRNQRMSCEGSKSLSLDTIDLSWASDSVGWDLVKRIFPKSWLRYFAATRSSQVTLPDGNDIKVRKFAPMGSAVCFPTQCVIFTSVVILSSLRHIYKRTGGFSREEILATVESFTTTPWRKPLMAPSVYGDDIICDSRITSDVIQTLEDLRFTINRDKSFTASRLVRESCGKFYHSGEDVTPIRFSIPFHAGRLTEKVVVSYVDLANRALDFGYLNLRRYLIARALRTPLVREKRGGRAKSGELRIPFVSDPNQFGLLTWGAISNAHLVREHNSDWQRGGWRCLVLGVRNSNVVNEPLHEIYSHNLYWTAKVRAEGLTEFGHTRALPEDTRFRWGWTPV